MARNAEMTARIEAAAGPGPLTFVVAGDSGAWPDPTADAILAALLVQAAALSPAFFANLGDFAGPGTRTSTTRGAGRRGRRCTGRWSSPSRPGTRGSSRSTPRRGRRPRARRGAPHPQWGFSSRERQFLGLLREHRVALVCCAHALFFDTWMQEGTRFVVSGGGGTALCSHFRGVCAPGEGVPADRGALFHAVALSIGAVGGRVLQAFDAPGRARIAFG